MTEITDKTVYEKVSEILNSEAPLDEQYHALDQLWFDVTNHHPQGIAAPALDLISLAQRMTLYPEKGGDRL